MTDIAAPLAMPGPLGATNDRIAIIDGVDDAVWTRGQLRDQIRRLAGGLVARGVGPGRTVALIGATKVRRVEFIVWHETYKVAAGQFEAIYANMPAMSLAAAGEYVPLSKKSRDNDRMGDPKAH